MNDDDEMRVIRDEFWQLAQSHALELHTRLNAGDVSHTNVKRIAHNLAGTAAMLGFDEVSELASVIDTKFTVGAVPSHEELERLIAALKSEGGGH